MLPRRMSALPASPRSSQRASPVPAALRSSSAQAGARATTPVPRSGPEWDVQQRVARLLALDGLAVGQRDVADAVERALRWSWPRARAFGLLRLTSPLEDILAYGNSGLSPTRCEAVYARVLSLPLWLLVQTNDEYPAHAVGYGKRRALVRQQVLESEYGKVAANTVVHALYIGIATAEDSAPQTRFTDDLREAKDRSGRGHGFLGALLTAMHQEGGGLVPGINYRLMVLCSFAATRPRPAAAAAAKEAAAAVRARGLTIERIVEALAPEGINLNSKPGGGRSAAGEQRAHPAGGKELTGTQQRPTTSATTRLACPRPVRPTRR
jgi:hypothetical protein